MERTDSREVIINCTDRRFSRIADIYQGAAASLPSAAVPQIGSYTCGNYFLELLRRLSSASMPDFMSEYDLVLPVFSEDQLAEFNRNAGDRTILNARNIVVNDWGMLRRFSGRQRVRLGRLLFREYRDHRYPAYEENGSYHVKAGTLTAALEALGYEITSIENDLATVNSPVDLGRVHIYYHFPYRQVSCAHICEYAAIGKAVEKKFIPDDTCCYQCFDTVIRHGSEYIKVGRNVFDHLSGDWLSAIKDQRIIYTPRW